MFIILSSNSKRQCACIQSDIFVSRFVHLQMQDPHFRTWGNDYYDFQSSCDMIHVRNPLLDLHIRTKYRGGFSAVSRIALRFGSDIFELDDAGDLWVNGLPAVAPLTLDGIYPVNSVATIWGSEVTVTLSGAQSIEFTARGIFGINIYISTLTDPISVKARELREHGRKLAGLKGTESPLLLFHHPGLQQD